jgi:hypothetical protein
MNNDMVMKSLFVAVLLLASRPTGGFAKSDAKPSWVDTIAPVVRAEPSLRFQPKVFHVTLKSNKEGAIWYKALRPGKQLNMSEKMDAYRDPITVDDEGTTIVYFFAEDLLGNKSPTDSMIYELDTRPPLLSVSPAPGRFRSAVTVHFTANEPCRFMVYSGGKNAVGAPSPESLVVKDSLSGFVRAIDRAGNNSPPVALSYVVDASAVEAVIFPREGIYNTRQSASFTVSPGATAFYSFDPSAPRRSFTVFQNPAPLPFGTTVVRYFAKNAFGWESPEKQARYIIDTLPPKIRFNFKPGESADTLTCFSKKNAVIRYSLTNAAPTDVSPQYEKPIIIAHRGTFVFKAVAKDVAGNVSEVFEWERRYDVAPAVLQFSQPGGTYTSPIDLQVLSNKPVTAYYTVDGSEPTVRSLLYKDKIALSREGATTVRAVAIDDMGIPGAVVSEEYRIDTRPPEVRVKIEENPKDSAWLLTLIPNEEAVIYYETGNALPTTASPVYNGGITVKGARVVRYFAVDKAGNTSSVKVIDELKRPMVSAYPAGGIYNKRIKITFNVNGNAEVFYRLIPDTSFRRAADSVVIGKEGVYALEYYCETPGAMRSPIRRHEYTLDMTPPHVAINVKKGVQDSVSVFFECTKNATIYYTIDGSNPFYSPTTRTRGNKFLLSRDRLSIYRGGRADVKLAFYAEDVAGNQSTMTILDVFKPQAVPNIPAGGDILYNRILSVALNTYDNRSQIYYARHGRAPTIDSSVYSAPITLVSSDTIIAFVIDAAGYRGEADTFVYRIDLPPSPDFTSTPDSVAPGTPVHFDASGSIDHETPFGKLKFRWDFIGKGVFETEFKADPRSSYSYGIPGLYRPVLEVKDENGSISSIGKQLFVRSLCPQGMKSIALSDGATYCIDTYEWPNIPGVKPMIGVSWVQAKMSCREAGKRLCTPEEWKGACRGLKATVYPYGNAYVKKNCPSEGNGLYKSGAFTQCTNEFGVFDMVGNAWEWVEGKLGDYPLMYGGSFSYGEKADCNLSSQGSVGSKSGEVGFRCCK